MRIVLVGHKATARVRSCLSLVHRWDHTFTILPPEGRLVRQIRADAWDLVEPLLPGQHLHVRRATSKFFIAGGSQGPGSAAGALHASRPGPSVRACGRPSVSRNPKWIGALLGEEIGGLAHLVGRPSRSSDPPSAHALSSGRRRPSGRGLGRGVPGLRRHQPPKASRALMAVSSTRIGRRYGSRTVSAQRRATPPFGPFSSKNVARGGDRLACQPPRGGAGLLGDAGTEDLVERAPRIAIVMSRSWWPHRFAAIGDPECNEGASRRRGTPGEQPGCPVSHLCSR